MYLIKTVDIFQWDTKLQSNKLENILPHKVKNITYALTSLLITYWGVHEGVSKGI